MAEQLAAKTRGGYKKLKLRKKSEEERKPIAARRFWPRFVIFIVLFLLCATAGAVTGYSGLGHGRMIDVFKLSTWTHIYDLVEKK